MIDGSPDLSGDILEERYRLTKRIGSEWFGDIYEAEQLRLGRTVSIKILATDANTPELLGRFLREAQALAKLQHPGIVFVIDFGVHRGRPFLVRDVVNGESLEKRLERVGRFHPEDAAPLLVAIAEALEHAHAAGVIHRHLTPSSVFFDENDRVRIGNFGLVRLLETAGAEQLTAPGTIVGWSPYTAPELAKGGQIDGRADLYALGVIGHQLLSGKLPQYENSIHEVAQLPKEAGALAAAIDRLRARSADARFPSAAWALNVLRAAAEELALPDASADINTAYSRAGGPPPLPPPSIPPLPPMPAIHLEAAVEESSIPSISSMPSMPSLPSIALPPEPEMGTSIPSSFPSLPMIGSSPPKQELSQDIPGFFDAAHPEEPSLSLPHHYKKPPSHFWKQFRTATPTFVILLMLVGVGFSFWYFVIGMPNPVGEARELVRAGKVSGVIQQLEDVVSKTPNDPAIHAALGYAYVHGNSSPKALDHFKKAIDRDANALEGADVSAIVGLLSIRGENSLLAQQLIERLGDRARGDLSSTITDKNTEPYLKCRAADALHALGQTVDLAEMCTGAAKGKSAMQRDLIARRMSTLGIKPR